MVKCSNTPSIDFDDACRYNLKELIEFGNYLLSDKRKGRTQPKVRKSVTHADIENWKQLIKGK